jgi:hypothetical protein
VFHLQARLRLISPAFIDRLIARSRGLVVGPERSALRSGVPSMTLPASSTRSPA